MIFRTAGALLLLFTSLIWAQVPEGNCNGPISTISTRPDGLQSYTAGPDGRIYYQFWRSGWTAFTNWAAVSGDITVPPCAPVSAIARDDQIDVYVTDTEGRIMTSSTNEGGGWGLREWSQVSGGLAEPGTKVEAVTARGDPSTVHLFVVGTDGSVWTTTGESSDGGDTSYESWQNIGSSIGGVPLGSAVNAASRAQNELNVFVTGNNGRIYTARWNGNQWGDFQWLSQGLAAPGAPVSAISRNPGELAALVVGTDGNIWATMYGNDGWSNWQRLTDGQQLQPTQSIGVASSAPDEIDYAFVGSDNRVYTGHWNNWTGWIGPWWMNGAEIDIAGTPAEAGPHIEMISRQRGMLDMFLWGLNTQGYGAYTAHYAEGNDGWCGFSLTVHEAGYCPL